jgi:PKD repeat protein
MPRLSIRIVVLAIVALSLIAPPTGPANAARTIRVPQDVATIQGAINAAVDGDTILVAPGTYRESLTIAKAITLASQYHTTGSLGYRDTTIIDAGGAAYAIWITSAVRSAVTITGFTIRNADDGVTINGPFRFIGNRVTDMGDGLDWEGGIGEVRGNIFEANGDDGIDLDLASFGVIEDNVIRNNGDDGIEVRLHDYTGPMMTIVIRRNVISGNDEDGIQLIDYAGLSSRTFSIENNLIQGNRMVGLGIMGNGNTIEDFSGFAMPEPVFVTNNTFAGNDHGMTGGAKVTARNNIFTGATRIGMKNVAGASTVAHNLFWANGTNFTSSNVDTTRTIASNPLLDATYRLQTGSPAIDAGVDVGVPYNGAAPDLGAYETGTTSPSTVSANAGPDQTAVPGTVVGFSGSASGGIAPYTYTWAFGDGTTGSGATVSHTYAAASAYTVTLTVKDTAGTTAQDTASVTVSTGTTPPPPSSGGTGQTLTFTPAADATIRSGAPTANYGGAATLETDASPVQDFLLKFNVTGVQGQPLTKAALRLYATNPSDRGGDVRRVANQTWSESTVTWSNAPAADAAVLASLGAVTAGQWYEVDVTPLVSDGDGAYTVRVSSTSSNGADYSAREGTAANRPQLVVTTDSSTTPAPTPAPLAANAGQDTTAVAGATVTLAGSASGGTPPYTYTWQFGDGTSGAGASVSHAYTTAGTYTATLVVKDAANQTTQDTAVVTVTSTTTPPPPPPAPPTGGTGQTLTFTAVADANVRQGSSKNYGSATMLVADASPVQDVLVKFTVAGVGSERVTKAALRLYGANESDRGGDVRRVASQAWSESTVTWSNAPAADPAILGSLPAIAAGRWYELDVTPLITGDGTYSVRVSTTSTNGVGFNSKEASTNRPQLVVTTDGTTTTTLPLATNAGPDRASTTGTSLAFNGSASGGTAPYTYTWQFGDGTTATGTSVSHAYTTAGTYTATVTVKDGANQTAADTATVTITGGTTPPPPPPPPSGEVRAFPGAEGFGAQTKGGRGGKVIAVTNLNDSGPGSLRAAIDATGPRIVVFRVGGTITVNSPIFIKNPSITIAGQTAPGGGIAIRNSTVNTGPVFAIDGDEVIIRHLRVRPGPSAASSSNVDGITIRGGRNVIVDHSSLSWAVDEIFNAWYDAQNVTVQWSIISESLLNSTHSEGPHGMGMLLGSEGSGNFSAHHNLFAHNNKRNPALKPGATTDFVNNVVYNWGDSAGWVGDQYGKVPLNFVGNYYKAGPDSDRSLPELDVYRYPTNLGFSLYLEGNIGPHRTSDLEPEDAVIDADGDPFVVGTRNPAPQVTTQTAAQAFELVLAGAGATKPQRDAVDTRVVSEVRNGTGRIIDHPTQVGGWPTLAPGTPPVDSDGDGMPDAWEVARGLNPSVNDSAGDRNGDGYTNVEEYINELAGN